MQEYWCVGVRTVNNMQQLCFPVVFFFKFRPDKNTIQNILLDGTIYASHHVVHAIC